MSGMSGFDGMDDVLFSGVPVDSPAMERLKEAAERADKAAKALTISEESVSYYKDKVRVLTTQTIPSLMAELGELSEVKSSWGTVKLNPFWSGKITPETEKAAFAWLEDNGHGGIVKRDIRVDIMKGDDRHAAEVKQQLDAIGADYEEKQGVHFQTLQAFIRGQAQLGTPVPQDLFHVFTGVVAKVAVTKE